MLRPKSVCVMLSGHVHSLVQLLHLPLHVATVVVAVVGATLYMDASAQVGTCTPAIGESYLDVNNVRAHIFNDGHLFRRGVPYVPYEVPKGGGKHAVHYSGFWIGGYVGSELRLAATWWGRSQFWSGPLDENGAPPPDCTAFDRLYNVSRTEIEEYEATGVAAPDLHDWPTGLGAPTLAPPDNRLDDDGDGEVDEANEETLFDITVPLAERKDRVIDLAAGERPAILGDQSIWWIMNDRGNERPQLPGSRTPPIGLEVHAMAFAFDVGGDVGNTTFYKYNLYLHGSTPLENAYSAFLVDPDLGNYQDDWIGSDTVRGMGFAWNADNDDEGGNGYGSPAPAVGFDFVQGPIVPSKGDTAVVSGVRHPDYRNLQMAHLRPEWDWPREFGARPNDLFYMFMRGRWWDGRPLTLGGNGRDFSDEPIDFMFPGDPGYSDAECQYWSQCNGDGAGTDYRSHDQRFVMSTGPFTLEPLELQQVVFAIVWARGLNNFDSVQKLKKANDLVQSLHDANYQEPSPPDAPDVTATPMDQEVLLEWSSAPTSNNFLESYTAIDPFARLDDNEYAFEGYEVIQYENELDMIGQTIAVYDVPNGVQRVIEALPPRGMRHVTATGTDGGVQTYHRVTGLTNYKTYHFGVQAYAYNDASRPKIFRGPVQRADVIPTRPVIEISDLALAALANGSAPDFVFENLGIGDGMVTANVVNLRSLKDAKYTVEFYALGRTTHSLALEADGAVDPRIEPVHAKQGLAEAVTFDIKRDGEVIFDGSVIGQPAPSWPNTGLYLDGLQFSIVSHGAGFLDFQVTANASGALDPPESAILGGLGFPDPQDLGTGTIGRQQATANVRWGLNAGGSASGLYGSVDVPDSFLGRVLRLGNNRNALGAKDYEMRFTKRCADGMDGITEPADCLALRPFGQSPQVMEVPFELWDAGIKTPDDPSDDVRLVPAICDTALCGGGRMDGAFDIGGDHPASDGVDDPLSDWVYFYRPVDITPGESGYDAYWSAGGNLEEVLARVVLVLENGGTMPPYVQAWPEVGTVFRIETTKPIQPGDVFTASTAGYGVKAPDLATARQRLNDIGIVPNPYAGASSYEVKKFADEVRFTNLPDVAIIRVFTLNGTLIKTIRKEQVGIATISWDLTTDHNLPIGSGLYLIHVEVPGVGETTLKFAAVKKHVNLSVY